MSSWNAVASQLDWLPWVVAGLFGLLVGSFLNVVIHRLPTMLQRQWQADCAELTGAAPPETTPFGLWQPRSRCPHCQTQVAAYDNLPVLSFLLLRGRCRHCDASISRRYPAVEIAAALLAVACLYRFGTMTLISWAAMLYCWILLAAAFIDYDHQLLPDSLTLPLLWLGLLVNLNGTIVPLADAVIGAAIGYFALWAVFQVFRLLTGKQGMGYGDFKLLGAIGAWLGWAQLPVVILIASISGAVIGSIALRIGKKDRTQPIPFGPFLALGGIIALFFGAQIVSTYLRFSGLA